MRTRLVVPALLVALLAAVAFVQPAAACMTTCIAIQQEDGSWIVVCDNASAASGLAPEGRTVVRMMPQNKAVVTIGPYVTPQMDRTYECDVALAPVPGVRRVDHIDLVEEGTGRKLTNYAWRPSTAASEQFSDLAKQYASMTTDPRDWQTFFSEVPGGSQGGIVHNFVLELTLEPGTTEQQLIDNLKEFGILANGSANPDGTLNYGHYHLRMPVKGSLSSVRVLSHGPQAGRPSAQKQ